MGRKRDPNRDKAYEIYKASGGEMRLTDIAAQLNASEGTVRGWKAKDKWENLLKEEINGTERSNDDVEIEQDTQDEDKDIVRAGSDKLFIDAVKIVAEAKQASVSLLQRRLRIGYTRAARLIDEMERRKMIGPYKGNEPREVYATPLTVETLSEEIKPKSSKRNAPNKPLERSVNIERSNGKRNAPIKVDVQEDIEEADEGEPNEDGLTPKESLFVKYYLVNFNATQAAIKSGYSVKSARYIGYELLTKPHIKTSIKKYTEEVHAEIGINIQRILTEHMKIAFSDITEFVEFGNVDEIIMTEEGPVIDPETGDPATYKRNFVTFKNSDEVDGTLLNEVKQGKDGISVKLHDKMKSLDVLAKYMDLLPDAHKRMIDQEKLKLDRERLEFDKQKASGEGDAEDDLIEDWVGAVIGDENEGITGV